MKMSDISQKLTERPGGFGGIIKQKLKQQIPFARGTQRKAKGAETLLKTARVVKSALQDWMNKAFRSSGGEKAPLTMAQFLGWVKKAQPKYAKGIETYARGEKAYAEHFAQAIDNKGNQTSTATDPKVKVGNADPDETGDKSTKIAAPSSDGGLKLEKDPKDKGKRKLTPDEQKGLDTINREAEEESAENARKEKEEEKQDLTASKGEDKEPKVDTSASIYEARLRALLEADEDVGADADKDEDVGTNRTKTLKDNQIDTLITMGIEKQIELNGGESIVDDPSEMQGGSSDKSDFSGGGGASDDFLNEYQDELVSVLTKVKNGDELDKRDKRNAGNMLYSLD